MHSLCEYFCISWCFLSGPPLAPDLGSLVPPGGRSPAPCAAPLLLRQAVRAQRDQGQELRPKSLLSQGSWPWEEARYLFRERVQPNLTNPSRTDVLPLPTRTLIAFYPKEQDAKGAGGFIPPRGPSRSQTTLDEVVCLALDCPPTPRAGRGPHHQFSRAD